MKKNKPTEPYYAILPRIDTAIINVNALGIINFPKVHHKNGHPKYDFDYSWKAISERLSVMNELIDRLENSFNQLHEHVSLVSIKNRDRIIFRRYLMDGEILVGVLKTTADQLLMMLSIFESRLRNGRYDNEIARDCIGQYIDDKYYSFLYQYTPMLRELNDAANGFKHSFLNLHVGTYESEPSVLVYYQPYNNLNKKGSPCVIQFYSMLPEYNKFLLDIKSQIIQLVGLINESLD